MTFVHVTFLVLSIGLELLIKSETSLALDVDALAVSGVVGSTVRLPCYTIPPYDVLSNEETSGLATTESPTLVIWWKNSTVIYTYDMRGVNESNQARHWTNNAELDGRAIFTMDRIGRPNEGQTLYGSITGAVSYLTLNSLADLDDGLYECRVDFARSQSRSTKVRLDVIVPPGKPRLFVVSRPASRFAMQTSPPSVRSPKHVFSFANENEVNLWLGPYEIGSSVELRCESIGGAPRPSLTWWRDHSLVQMEQDIRSNSDGKKRRKNQIDLIEETHSLVSSKLTVGRLRRDDLHSIFTCQASNTNLSVPLSTSVKLDMHFPPLTVQILEADMVSVSAGQRHVFKCQVTGSRPEPKVTWWLDGNQIRSNIAQKTSPDGNVTVSTLIFTPNKPALSLASHHGRRHNPRMTCRASNEALTPDTNIPLSHSINLRVNYAPVAMVRLGSQVNSSGVEEGADVYFECQVSANPPVRRVTWTHNGHLIGHNPMRKILVTNQTLVLQHLSRIDSGAYACSASNDEGTSSSNLLHLDVKFAPVCKRGLQTHIGVASGEQASVLCEVLAHPSDGLRFSWHFNSSAERIELPDRLYDSSGTRSTARHTPQSSMDYGSLVCSASNEVGPMVEPCVFHLIPARIPDPVADCFVRNQTSTTLDIHCQPQFNGGLEQHFLVEVWEASHPEYAVANTTNMRSATFQIGGLKPGSGYVASVYSYNDRGRSHPVKINTFTLPPLGSGDSSQSQSGNSIYNGKQHQTQAPLSAVFNLDNQQVRLTPIHTALLLVGASLVAILLVVSFALCIRAERARSRSLRDRRRRTYLSSASHYSLPNCNSRGDNSQSASFDPLKSFNELDSRNRPCGGGSSHHGAMSFANRTRRMHDHDSTVTRALLERPHCMDSSSSSCRTRHRLQAAGSCDRLLDSGDVGNKNCQYQMVTRRRNDGLNTICRQPSNTESWQMTIDNRGEIPSQRSAPQNGYKTMPHMKRFSVDSIGMSSRSSASSSAQAGGQSGSGRDAKSSSRQCSHFSSLNSSYAQLIANAQTELDQLLVDSHESDSSGKFSSGSERATTISTTASDEMKEYSEEVRKYRNYKDLTSQKSHQTLKQSTRLHQGAIAADDKPSSSVSPAGSVATSWTSSDEGIAPSIESASTVLTTTTMVASASAAGTSLQRSEKRRSSIENSPLPLVSDSVSLVECGCKSSGKGVATPPPTGSPTRTLRLSHL